MKARGSRIYVFFILILLLVPIGFKRYFLGLFDGRQQVLVLHIHTVLMMLWCITLILQPILILRGDMRWHRRVGQIFYYVFPLIVLAVWSTIIYSYERMTDHLSSAENAQYIFLPISQLILFTVFYLVAMQHTKNRDKHMGYICISSVSLLGPTLGRIDLGIENADLWGMNIAIAMLLTIYWDRYELRRSLMIGLSTYAIMHIAYHTLAHTALWHGVAIWLFD